MDQNEVITYELRDLPIEVVEYDENQPREKLNAHEARKSLEASIKRHGVQQPIAVTEYEPGRFKIIDGHRRYLCAKELKLAVVPCLVYPKLPAGQLEIRRYEMQNIRRPWKPLERSDALFTMKKELGCNSNRELAQCVGISTTMVSGYLTLRDQLTHVKIRFTEHKLPDATQLEMVRLKPHLRKVGGLEADEIIDIILQRHDERKIISKDIRTIKSAFIRIDLYEDLLIQYLNDPDMPVKKLEEQISRDGFSGDVQKVVASIAKKHSNGEDFTDKERDVLYHLQQLLREVVVEEPTDVSVQ